MATDSISITVCPKCGCEQSDREECAKCGIIFVKYRPMAYQRSRSRGGSSLRELTWLHKAKGVLLESDDKTEAMTLVGRTGIYLLLLWWGWRLIVTPLETNYTGESFLHLINLPFHEAGHLIFMPFGRFMMYLGGSLGQILMPIVCLVAFLIKTRDPFGAAVALWWTAENFMDVAPYINDARTLDLVLLGGATGKETDGHDWENILGMLDWLPYDHRLAHVAYHIGTLLMLISLAWGGWLLWRNYRRLRA